MVAVDTAVKVAPESVECRSPVDVTIQMSPSMPARARWRVFTPRGRPVAALAVKVAAASVLT